MLNELVRRVLSPAVAEFMGLNVKSTIGPFPEDATFQKSLWQLSGGAGRDSLEEPYKNSVWVYASINTRAKNAAKVPLRLYKRSEQDKPIESGPLFNLIRNPNPFMTHKVMIEAISIFMDLHGEVALLLKRPDITTTPVNIWVLNPKRFDMVYNKEKKAQVGWLYNGVSDIPLKTFEVLLLKYFNPYNDLRGLSPLEPAKLGVNQDYYAAKYNENFFKQGAKVGGFISVDGELDDKQFNRMINQFEERHQGYERAHRILLMEGGAKFTEAKLTQKDMEFIQLRKLSRQEIFAAYKVNEVILGFYSEVQSYEGIRMAHKAFWEESMVPHLGYIEDYLNDTLFLQIEKGQYMVKFDLATVGALHDDFKARIDTAKIMGTMGFPINEINRRLQLGMPEVPWGDVWWVPMGQIPADVAMEQAENPPDDPETPAVPSPGKPGKPVKPPETPDPTATPEDDANSKPKKPQKDDTMLWHRYITIQVRVEELMKSKIKKFMFEQRKMVLENIAKDKFPVFDYKTEVVKLQRLMGNLYAEALKLGAGMVTEELGEENKIIFKLEHPEVVKYLKARSDLIPAKIMGTIYKGLEKIFSKKELKDLYAESVRMLYNSVTKRIGLIARTESSAVLVVGRVIHMQRAGCRYHEWISSKHDSSRESHKNLNGKVVKIGDTFHEGIVLRYPGDLMAPVDEAIGCRCFTIMAKG